jgi:hypothetical protein
VNGSARARIADGDLPGVDEHQSRLFCGTSDAPDPHVAILLKMVEERASDAVLRRGKATTDDC